MNKYVYFLDIDDCLIETSRLGNKELHALYNSLVKGKVNHPKAITEEFAASFHRLYDHHQGKILSKNDLIKLKQYMSRLEQLQAKIVQKFGQIKKWSREVCLYVAAEKYKVKLSEKQLMHATFALWKGIAKNTPFYPDANKFLLHLLNRKIPLYLISSSDCRLLYNQEKGKFIYDPNYSRNLKLERLTKFIKLGIPKENIFIGDPLDKPDPYIFRQALKKAKKDLGDFSCSVMIGDSIKNDLLPAKKAGFQKLIWLNRHKSHIANDIRGSYEALRSFNQLPLNH